MRAILMMFLVASSLGARTLRVPAEYATIQSAFDVTLSSDTVLVALGTYAEALAAPDVPFVLKGDVVPDTGDYPRPVIDPASLPGSDSLCCMTIPATSVPTVEDIHFRNGPAMYPHEFSIGGLRITCLKAIFRQCVFDSLYEGLYCTVACSLCLEQCRFQKVYSSVFSPGGGAAVFVHATDCSFTGSGWAHIMAYGGATISRCQFGANAEGPMCWILRSVFIQDCQFGPSLPGDPPSMPPLRLNSIMSGVVKDNVFTGLRIAAGLGQFRCACVDTDNLEIRSNLFVDNLHVNFGGSTGIDIACESNGTGIGSVKMDSNRFENNSGNVIAPYRGLSLSDRISCRAVGNRFHNLSVDSHHHVPGPGAVISTAQQSSLEMHGNRFDSTGLALWDDRIWNGDTLDLRGNWWGDPSGPYHEESNPQGLGDTVLGAMVDISGWCTDTACTVPEGAQHRFILHASSFRLLAVPNPFNNTTVLHLEVPQPEILRVELFDILGRRVRELWAGAVADQKEIAVDGGALASGVYFVRATNTIWNRPLVSTKIVLLK